MSKAPYTNYMATALKQLIIAPSILACDHGKFSAEIEEIARKGADWIHIDVMDGSFVPPITFGDNIVKVAKAACARLLDVHLMISNPERHFDAFAKAGASRITIHQEACPQLRSALQSIRERGIAAGVAINPATPAQSVFDVLDVCDLVLVMTVNPGWGGQPFIDSCLPKIKEIHNEIIRRNVCVHIEVDGGINPTTAKACVAAGANVLVAGSNIFGASDRAQAINALRGV